MRVLHGVPLRGFALMLHVSQALAAAAAAPAHKLTIDTSQSTKSLFGIANMIEDTINWGTEGGLYAELIYSRAFQNNGSFEHWEALGGATIQGTKANPLSPQLPHSIVVSPTSGSKTTFGVLNPGFYGIPVKADDAYAVSFWARADSAASVQATAAFAANASRQILGSVDIPLDLTTKWKQFKATIKPKLSAPDEANTFQLTFAPPSPPVQLNLISVLPHSAKDFIFRKDLYDALDDLKTPYARILGGNQLEGFSISDRFNWSDTVGPAEATWTTRPGRPSVWIGTETGGFGLHEHLNLFESLGSTKILSVYAGYSLDGVAVPKSQIGDYVKSVIDELHYVLDPPGSSALAKQREVNGRAEPWSLGFVEIGNEDDLNEDVGQATYSAYRYEAFYRAIKKEFPHLELISTSNDTGSTPIDHVDKHVYKTPNFFFDRYDYFDKWPRDQGKVHLLELQTMNSGKCKGNIFSYDTGCRYEYPQMYGSLAEAAYLLGAERNGDVVMTAAYAPYLSNRVLGPQWTPNLIDFDWQTVVRSTSYWVQWAMSRHRISQILAVTSSSAPGPIFWSAGVSGGEGKEGSSIVVKLVNNASTTESVSLGLASGHWPTTKAQVWTLSGKSEEDSNTMEAPHTVVPATSTMNIVGGPTFDVEMPPYSFKVITVPMDGLKKKRMNPDFLHVADRAE